MSEYSVCRYSFSIIETDLWNNFISIAKNGLFFFNRNFMDYHKDRFEDHSLIIKKSGEVIALFPATEDGKLIISHGGLTFGSLIVTRRIKSVEVLNIFADLTKYYKMLGFEKIIYKCIPYIFHSYPSQEDLYALFRFDAKLIRRDVSSVVYLTDPIYFSQSLRNLVNRFDKKNCFTFSENTRFDVFWKLLSEVLAKFNASPVHSLDEILLLKDRFDKQIRLFTVYEGDELLAGTLIFDFGSTVHTQYMANSQKGRTIGALNYLIFQLISREFSDKTHFSFGISNEKNGQYLNEGLIQQKENMGGRAVALDFYELML